MHALTIRTASVVASVTAALAIVAVSTPAAAFRTQNYTYRQKVFSLNANNIARGTVSCPVGQLVVAGGAYWFRPGQPLGQSDAGNSTLMANTPTPSGQGWFATGAAIFEKLAISIFCLPKSTLGGSYVVKTKLLTPIPDPTDPSHYSIASAQLACPSGQSSVTGGAGWYSTAQQGYVSSDAKASALSSDSPTLNGNGWWAAGFQVLDGGPISDRFRATVMCRPSRFVGAFSVVKTDFAIADGNLAFGYEACASGNQIVSSGAYWHETGQSPQNSPIAHLRLTALAPTTDKAGMWAAGQNGRSTTEHITFVVECRPI